MDEKLKALLNAIGAIAEMSGCLRDALINNAFTREEACDIVKDVIVKAMYSDTKSENN